MNKDSKVIFRIPVSLHEDFKATCLKLGVAMSDVLRQMATQFCAENGMLTVEQNKENENDEAES